MGQLSLDLSTPAAELSHVGLDRRSRMVTVLGEDLDFHQHASSYATHNLHAFPAKFPPQLPRKFIDVLTEPHESLLDPMMGSGTTVLEGYLANRRSLGFDIDPLALLLGTVKVTPIDVQQASHVGYRVLDDAQRTAQLNRTQLADELDRRFDHASRAFLDYWFSPGAQLDLMALLLALEPVPDVSLRHFLELALSAIIITKSGGVSLARDLAHTRPHRVTDKPPRPVFDAFRRRLQQNLASMAQLPAGLTPAEVGSGDAQSLPLPDRSIDLIVTSPPYASNAIDYMRAHKFSLVWLGHPIASLTQRRKDCIGGEAVDAARFETLPPYTEDIVQRLEAIHAKKGAVLRRYYSEMTRVIREMVRVLAHDRVAVLVVGSSVMAGMNTMTHECLADIGRNLGFAEAHLAVRRLDRNRRMMPARMHGRRETQIEERMHEEYVIGFFK